MGVKLGEGSKIDKTAIMGLKYSENIQPPKMGMNVVIGAWIIIYGIIVIRENFITGHFANKGIYRNGRLMS